MHFLLESIIVGIYAAILYLPLSFISPISLRFFILGFLKHFLAGFLGLHNYYCNNGYQCIQIHRFLYNEKYQYDESFLWLESFFEGIYFMILGYLFFNRRMKPFVLLFLMGSLTHFFFELLGIHRYICEKKCIKK